MLHNARIHSIRTILSSHTHTQRDQFYRAASVFGPVYMFFCASFRIKLTHYNNNNNKIQLSCVMLVNLCTVNSIFDSLFIFPVFLVAFFFYSFVELNRMHVFVTSSVVSFFCFVYKFNSIPLSIVRFSLFHSST